MLLSRAVSSSQLMFVALRFRTSFSSSIQQKNVTFLASGFFLAFDVLFGSRPQLKRDSLTVDLFNEKELVGKGCLLVRGA